MISENLRLQYLDALGIDAWISRSRAARLESKSAAALLPGLAVTGQVVRYTIGPGSGQTLLLCRQREEASSKLASDIARCLDEAPVWGWRSVAVTGAEGGPEGQDLETAIRDRLFTRVLVFDDAALAGNNQSEVMGSARIIHAPLLAELASNPQHKRRLWSHLLASGWCTRFG